MNKKYVYLFSEGNKDMKELLGGKGANLAEMTNLGLPVPSGFTITTEACLKYYEDSKTLNSEIKNEILAKLVQLEEQTGKKLGDIKNPLLLSVRSGARASMPGMMDTILNLGLNDEVAKNFSEATQNKRFVYDSYRRLIMMFANVVKGYSKDKFERFLDEYKTVNNKKSDLELTGDDMEVLTLHYKEIYRNLTGEDFPSDAKEQLILSVMAVFRSWNNDRAIYYRKLNGIPDSWGTAVNVQEMVYGNRGDGSGTGVAFSRNPATGENELYGEYLMNAQGEDVVAGIRTPSSIEKLKEDMPEIYEKFKDIAKRLELHYKDMQDMEFTIENGKLFILQTRNGKRTANAAIKIAVDLVHEGLITKNEAILRVETNSLESLLHPTFKEEALNAGHVIAKGLAASPGASAGKIYFNAKDVIEHAKNGEDTILVTLETNPEDIEGMNYARGVLTIRGGMTSHAAVVARGMGRCCISGCNLDIKEKTIITKDGMILNEGDEISLDGTTGNVYLGKLEMEEASISGYFKEFMEWVDNTRKLHVRANAENVRDAKMAIKLGAEGIGLCRTEHMFFSKNRILNFRKMIISDSLEERESALELILPYQRSDFEDLYRVVSPYPIVIRYLDPPLHEFLPKTLDEIQQLADALKVDVETIKTRIASLKEFNPMMGHRGCRLGITYPEIVKMQTRAVIEAAINVKKEGIEVKPEIMIPLVGDYKELEYVKQFVSEVASKIMSEENTQINYTVGTMIELPRAAILADEIALGADFFSFGTNDLTQMTYGFSRDDSEKFLNDYYNKKIFMEDPFKVLDEKGVGKLIQIALEKAKKVNPSLEAGICGEHGGEEKSIKFFSKNGLDYVSCSPYRVPIARLAAAKCAIENSNL
jgi:pyruvate,orthophosphate dikinase